MKKLFIALGLLCLLSCSDEDFKETSTNKESNDPILNLMPFNPSCIVAGGDPDGINRDCIQNAINAAADPDSDYDGLDLGNLDCYVNVTDGLCKSLNIPSNFTLRMGPDAYLRVQPNSSDGYRLIAIGGCNDDKGEQIHNVNIIGGHLVGDREEHDNTHIHGNLIEIESAYTVNISGVSLSMANMDGLWISGKALNDTDLDPYDINIDNCVFDSNRRNNMSITDGYGIDVGNCTFKDAGIDLPNSAGYAPKMALNVEGLGDENTGLWSKHPHHVTIHDNTESGSGLIGLGVGLGSYVTIQNNNVKSGIGYGWAHHITISENTISGAKFGIGAGLDFITGNIHDNVITGNIINECEFGIDLHNDYTEISKNQFIDCSNLAITFKNVTNILISQNVIKSKLEKSRGIAVSNTCFADNVTIEDNMIELTGSHYMSQTIHLEKINTGSSEGAFEIHITGNDLSSTGPLYLGSISGVKASYNKIYSSVGEYGAWIDNVSAFEFDYNEIGLYNTGSVNSKTMTVKDCSGKNFIRNNTIGNLSSSADAYSLQIKDSNTILISGNGFNQPFNVMSTTPTRAIDANMLTNVNFVNNTAYIGSTTLVIFAANTTGCNFYNNTSQIAPTTRQNINGVLTVLP